MLRPQILGECLPFGFEQLHILFRFEVISFGTDVRKGHSRRLLISRLRPCCRAVRIILALGAIEVLIQIEQTEKIVFRFQLRVLLVQPHKVSGRAIPLFLNETNVVLLLKIEHLVLVAAQIFLDLDSCSVIAVVTVEP